MVVAKVVAISFLFCVFCVGLLSLAGVFRFWYSHFEHRWIPEGERPFARAMVAMGLCGALIVVSVLGVPPAMDAICAWVVA